MKDLGHGRAGGGVNYVGARFTSLANQVTLPAYTTLDAAPRCSTRWDSGMWT